jgi:DNA-binding transcriptional LysR family regulator
MVFGYLRGFKVTPKIVLESGNVDLLQELVSQDNGVSLLARVALQDDLKNIRLRTLPILECTRP